MDIEQSLKKMLPSARVTKGTIYGEWACWHITVSRITFKQLNEIKKKIPKIKIVVEADTQTKNIVITVKRFIQPF